jgi:dUTPase
MSLPIFLLRLSPMLSAETIDKYKTAVRAHNLMVLSDDHPNSGFDLYLNQELNCTKADLVKIDLMVSGSMTNGNNKCMPYTLEPRSSISKYPLRLANNRGIIDMGYRGNLIACCDCTDNIVIAGGTRLFQILHPTLEPFGVQIVDDLNTTSRGMGGFGSTGN